MPEKDLEGKVAMITGASYGLGREIASELARRGAAVMLTDISDGVAAASRDLQAQGFRAAAVHVDVSQRGAVKAGIAATVGQFGRLDILVANAAMPRSPKTILEMDDLAWEGTMAVNLRGTLYCIQEAALQMILQGGGGRIVTIGSTAGLKPYKRRSHYCVSKAAVIHLSKVAGLELAEHKITVNCVCPGQTRTENLNAMISGGGLNAAEAEEMRKRQAAIPLGPNDPIDIAKAVAFFASPSARTVTGQVLAVEGGGLMTG